MSSRRHAYMQTLIDKGRSLKKPNRNPFINYINNPNELFSTCGNAAAQGGREFSYDEFVKNIGDEDTNLAQQELAIAFKRNVFSDHEKLEIYTFIRDNSMADSSAASSAAYSAASSEASSEASSVASIREPKKSVKKSATKPVKKQKGGSRKTRRSKSNRQRNKTYRR
jgi:hypothetical protein